MGADTLINCERVEPAPVEREAVPGYWLGSAASQVRAADEWQRRALAAEALVIDLRKALVRWRRPAT